MMKEEEIKELFRQHQDGRFEVRKILGIGGMGVVVQAFDVKLEVLRAIKIFNPELLAHEGLVLRFKQEAKIMAKINHANIVQVFDVGEVGTYHYMVLEWIDGGSLSSVLRASGAMHPRVALEMIYPVCDALTVAHKRGIIHRDIKPDNILITKEGVPKVTDFGISHMDDDQKKRVTSTGEAMGTEGYASPQQLSNFALTDARDDVYSVAVTFWALMANLRPPSILFFHDIETYPELLAAIPVCLHGILKKAVSYVSADRYQTMEEFAHALKSVEDRFPPLGGNVIVTVPVGDDQIGVADDTAASETRFPRKTPAGNIVEPTRLAKRIPAPARDGSTLAYHPSGEVPVIEIARDPDADVREGHAPPLRIEPNRHRRSFLIVTSVLSVIGLGLYLWTSTRSPEIPVSEQKTILVATPDVSARSVDVTIAPNVSISTDVSMVDLVLKSEPDIPTVVVQIPVEMPVEKPQEKKDRKGNKPSKSIVVKAGETLLLKPEVPKLTTPQPPPYQGGGEKVQVRLKIQDEDSIRVWLVGPGGRHKMPGSVAPGIYKVVAIFKDQDTETDALSKLEVTEGASLQLKCDSAREVCWKL